VDGGVSLVIVPAAVGRYLRETIAGAERQGGRVCETIAVDHPGLTERSREALVALAGRAALRIVGSTDAAPGALRNAAIRVGRGGYVVCLQEGDVPDPGYCDAAAARLDADRDLAFVTPWTRSGAGRDGGALRVPADCRVETVLDDPWVVAGAAMFRRGAWEAVGGVAEDLSWLETYDFWLRLLTRGFRGAVIEQALVWEVARPGSRYRELIGDPAGYARAVRAVIERHRPAFEADPARRLHERERTLLDLLRCHRRLVSRRDAVATELAGLREETARLVDRLQETGRAGVDWGDLRRTRPLSRDWGYDRGTPVDRYYIERFVERHAGDVRGAVLEVQENDLTVRFGGDRVTRSDVVDIDPGNPRATVLADLRHAPGIPADSYDCVILTQTLHVVDDMPAVLSECQRMLKPGGVLLATLPCLSRVCLEYGRDGDFWRVTEAGARTLFAAAFGPAHVDVRGFGNVLAGSAFLYGVAADELAAEELDTWDPYHPALVGVRAVKAPGPGPSAVGTPGSAARDVRPASVRERTGCGMILLYHRVTQLGLDHHGLAVTPEGFWDQMAHLARHCQPLALDELVSHARDGQLPRGAVAVTFDDGYADNLTTASPILAEFRIPATFFVGGGVDDQPGEFWWDLLERILLGSPHLPPVLEVELGGVTTRLETGTRDERQAAHRAVYRAIAGAALAGQEAVLARLLAWSGVDPSPRATHRRMTGGEIQRLAARPGHAIGAHGLHHLALPRQPLDVQRREVAESKSALEALLGRPVTAFAYPFGDVAEATVGVVREAGFAVGLTCETAAVRVDTDPLRLPRLEVKVPDPDRFAAILREWTG
jgi:peptidoglycan/xylan/chitin deacetylase (PgdA/CDA1 family)/SAM-dependent methyltransferase